MAQIDLTVPDLGGFNEIPVIEVLVAPGDTVKKDDPLVTLESDKATMEVPASSAGTVREIKVKVGDKVSQGTVLVTVEPAASDAPAPPSPPPPSPAPAKDAVGIVAAEAGTAEEATSPNPPTASLRSRPLRRDRRTASRAHPYTRRRRSAGSRVSSASISGACAAAARTGASRARTSRPS
jgi:pyruvate/2-oxoglutarate dehydrogenase complex dihydrolipoamide acyltransferase (E2) component